MSTNETPGSLNDFVAAHPELDKPDQWIEYDKAITQYRCQILGIPLPEYLTATTQELGQSA